MIVSATVVGAMISALGSGPLCDYFGRRLMVLVAAAVFVIGAIVMAISPDYIVLIIGRFIIGLGVGSASMNMPIIISEMAETSVRGMLVTCINVAITFGQFAACLIAGSLSTVDDGWRYMLGLAGVPAVVQFIGFLFMPESPRYLVQKGRIDEATLVLQDIRGYHDVYGELEEIRLAVVKDNNEVGEVAGKEESKSFRSQMSLATTRRALLVGCLLQISQQIAGINTIM